MPAGYSKRPLFAKLGIKAGSRIHFHNAPEGYLQLLGKLPPDVTILKKSEPPLDLIQFFTKTKQELDSTFQEYRDLLQLNGMLWISWPKISSGVRSDLTEDIIRTIGLKHGMVDVKVCAVDDTWSGLKFVIRLSDRKK